MLDIKLHTFEIPFKHAFTISRHSKTVQPTLIVELMNGKYYGLGETTANTYYNMTVAHLMEDLERIRPMLEKISFSHPEELWAVLYKELKDNLFALCAIDIAAWDMYAKIQGKKLYELWGLDISNNPLTDYTIGIDTIDKMVAKMHEFPWPVYKIKLGTEDDLAIIKALRKETDALFRVDANCAWDFEQTIENAQAFKDLGVEFIEQPMPDPGDNEDDWQVLKEAYKKSALPLMADESCIKESD